MLRLALRNIKWTLLSYKFYVSVFLGALVYLTNTISLVRFSERIKEPLNILDGFIYSSADQFAVALLF